jgi:RNA polymerase sigma-70 factor (ECF subfamily)
MVERLIERIRNKDQQAMKEFYLRYAEELSSVCHRYVPNHEDEKDVLQNSFVKILTSLPTIDYRGEVSFYSWMRKVVVNESLNLLRERKRLKWVSIDASNLQVEDNDVQEVSHLSSDELYRLICELPDGYRTVLNLYVVEGYSHKEIAEMLGIKASTSASQLWYAKQRLAERIKDLMKGK